MKEESKKKKGGEGTTDTKPKPGGRRHSDTESNEDSNLARREDASLRNESLHVAFMGKAYLRYDLSAAWGVICSGSSVVYDADGAHVCVACLEDVVAWNKKTGEESKRMHVEDAEDSSGMATALERSSDVLAVSHEDGSIRLWREDGCVATFRGHRGRVDCLRFNRSGDTLVSGGADGDLFMWDIGDEAGRFRLRGHVGPITGLAWIENGRKKYVVSASKDGRMKVWDLDEQHCCQTLVIGQAGEGFSLDSYNDTVLATSSDNRVQVFDLFPGITKDAEEGGPLQKARDGNPSEPAPAEREDDSDIPILVLHGSLDKRELGKCTVLRWEEGGRVFGILGTGKRIEFCRRRNPEEVTKKLKRKQKRRREKLSKQAARGLSAEESTGRSLPPEGTEMDQREQTAAESSAEAHTSPSAEDRYEALPPLQLKHKAKGFAFCPSSGSYEPETLSFRVAVVLQNNQLEEWQLHHKKWQVVHTINMAGHRSDVRSVCLSQDDSLLMTCSHHSVKFWNPHTGSCLRTVDSGYGLSSLFVPGGRHAVCGTKEGKLELFDVGSGLQLGAPVDAHEGAVWSLSPLPDGSGFVSGSADKDVKFWQYQLMAKAGGSNMGHQLDLVHTRTLKMTDDVLCVRVSPSGSLLAVALLDSTIKIFFTDSLNFFLSLYGHKLPVLCMDISSDGTLLASGSADKNLKLWGLDFGDCHRSLFAHADSVMTCAFVKDTHYLFTGGKDKVIKYWDADKFQLLLTLNGHHAEVWSLAVSSTGDFVISGSHDRSIRKWERTDEPFFLQEEEERRMDTMFEEGLEGATGLPDTENTLGIENTDQESLPAGRQTGSSIDAADAILSALDLAEAQAEKDEEFMRMQATAAQVSPPPPNPLMLGLRPAEFVVRTIANVRSADLEQALVVLPFPSALRLLDVMQASLEKGQEVELICRITTLLVRLHLRQLVHTPDARRILSSMRERLRPCMETLKDTLGLNLAAIAHLRRGVQSNRQGHVFFGMEE